METYSLAMILVASRRTAPSSDRTSALSSLPGLGKPWMSLARANAASTDWKVMQVMPSLPELEKGMHDEQEWKCGEKYR